LSRHEDRGSSGRVIAAVLVTLTAVAAAPAYAFDSIPWVRGPTGAALGDVAGIRVPEGFVFTGEDDVERLMEQMENPATGDEIGFLAPAGFLSEEPGDDNWYLLFEFVEVGHVSEAEQVTLDAGAIFDRLREINTSVSEERRKRGWETLELADWAAPPVYDPAARALTWALRFREPSGEVVENHFCCRLGRRGVMSVTLGAAAGVAAAAGPRMRELLDGLSFLPGHDWGDFEAGDEVFEPGLAGLILGQRSSGLPAFLGRWRLILMGFVLVAALAAALVFWRKRQPPVA
jgi:uncharacterized membrane-anchored protein